MKKLFILTALVLSGYFAEAQTNPMPTTDSLIKFINKYIRNDATTAFTNNRLNTALVSAVRFIEAFSGGGGVVNLDTARGPSTATIQPSGGGTVAIIKSVDVGSNKAGLMTPSMKLSLDSAFTKRVVLNDSTTVYYNSQGIEVYRVVDSAFSFINSLEANTSRTAQLKNDAASPGANKVYGTDGSGVKGWKADPAGAGTSTNSITGDGSGGTPFKLLNDASSPGSNKAYRTNDYGVRSWSSVYDLPRAYGLLYSQNTWASLSDFARSGGAWGTSGGKIIMSGGVNDFSRFLVIDTSSLTRWTIGGVFILATPSGTTYGVGAAIQSVNANGGQPGLAVKMDATNGVNSGKVYIYAGEGMGVKATSTGTVAFSASDKILISLERNYDTVKAIVKNITTNAAELTLSYYYPLPTSAASLVFTPNTGEIGMVNYGGSHTLDSIFYLTPEAKYSDLLVEADSKGDGLYAQTWRGRWVEQLAKRIPSLIVHSGSYDQTTQTMATLDEIMKLKPKQVLMTRMSNDARFGLSLTTTLANIARFRDSLTSIGSDLLFALFPENPGTNQTNQLILLDTLNKLYPGKVINTMGDLFNKPGSIYAADGVHLSELGNNEAAKSILNSGKLNYVLPDIYESYVRKDKGIFTAPAYYINKPFLQSADSLAIPYKKWVDSLVAAATSGGSSTSYLDSVFAKGGRLSTNRTSNMGGSILTWDSVGGHYNKMQDFAFYGLQDKGGNWTLRHQTGTSGGQGYILTDYYNYTGGVIRFNALGAGYYKSGNFSFGSSTDFGKAVNIVGGMYLSGLHRSSTPTGLLGRLSDSTIVDVPTSYFIYPWDMAGVDSANTSNATNTTVKTLTIPDASRGIIEVRMACIGTDDGTKGLTGIKRVRYKKTGGTLTLGTVETEMAIEYDGGLTTATFTITTSSNNIIIQVTGEAATNLKWRPVYLLTNNAIAL